ncbi:MAG TPA: hypothetical protein VHC49_08880 [Mycobacteriales bacterium]|nr:hypothetical protein [Mycobacteriales bacterium]
MSVQSPVAAAPQVELPFRVAPYDRRRPFVRLRPGWPLTALLVGYPLWWALGVAQFSYVILAVPMVLHLLRRRPIRVPRGFGIWVLFLGWVIAGGLLLGIDAPGTLPGSGGLVSWTTRVVSYSSLTVLFLYAGNLREDELPRGRIVRQLALLFCVAIVGGLASLAWPHFEFTSPFELLLPHSIRSNQYVQSLVHPALAQVQDVLGYASPRPKAPFEYTNSWGNNVAILSLWFVAAHWRRHRWLTLAGLCVAAVPIVYSLNRGMWIGLCLAVGYVAFRLALRGRLALLGGIVVGAVLAGGILVASPLGTVFQGRLDNGRSDQIRANLSDQAVSEALTSPFVGYGNTRTALGSPESIAIGATKDCPQCGNRVIGSNGQLWQLFIANGFLGAAIYISFFGSFIWRYRHDVSPIGLAGTAGLVLTLFFGLFYSALQSAAIFYLLCAALLWRNDIERRRPA